MRIGFETTGDACDKEDGRAGRGGQSRPQGTVPLSSRCPETAPGCQARHPVSEEDETAGRVPDMC